MVKFPCSGQGESHWAPAEPRSSRSLSAVLVLAGGAGAGKHRVAAADEFLKAISAPLKLRAPGDHPEIRYDISCPPPDGNIEGPGTCDGGGTVYFRAAKRHGQRLRCSSTPQPRSAATSRPCRCDLGGPVVHVLRGRDGQLDGALDLRPARRERCAADQPRDRCRDDRSRDARLRHRAAAVCPGRECSLGSGDGQVGLEDGVDQTTAASSFDGDSSGSVYLLDEANGRMLEVFGRRLFAGDRAAEVGRRQG